MTSPFGICPRELENTFPIQSYDVSTTGSWSADEIEESGRLIAKYCKGKNIVANLAGGYLESLEVYVDDFVNVCADERPTSPDSLYNLRMELKNHQRVKGKDKSIHGLRSIAKYQFGENGERKACTNKRQLYLMREGDLLPVLFALPPSALKAYDNYRVQARLTLRTPMCALLTRITLKNKKSANGSEYSSPVFTAIGKLPIEEGRRMEAFAHQIMDAAQRAGVDADDMSNQETQTSQAGGGFVQVDEEDLPFVE